MNPTRRAVVTGIGVVTPLGVGADALWESLLAGRSGIGPVRSMDASAYACRIAGEVQDFDPKPWYGNPRDARRFDRYTHFAIASAKLALEHGGLQADAVDPLRSGVMVASGVGGLGSMEINHRKLLERGPGRVSPFMIPQMIANMAGGQIAIETGWQGPNFPIVTACATANHNIGEALRMIQHGDAEVFLAGGSEAAIVPLGLSGFGNMKALSGRNDEPERASRPFDVDRDGFVMGEGAGVLLIEEIAHARARGAPIICELAGYAGNCDAYHMTAPHPDGSGAARCMRLAMEDAGLNPDDVDYVNAHGTSTPLGDIAETKAIKAAFGPRAKDGLMVSSTKSMTGHLLGAAGGVEAAAAAFAIRDGAVPPTINLENPDPECDLDYVPNTARETTVRAALSNSFGFGGHNASIVLRRWEG